MERWILVYWRKHKLGRRRYFNCLLDAMTVAVSLYRRGRAVHIYDRVEQRYLV